MPKMKTNKGAQKRFKITGTGKVTKRKAFNVHKFEYKSGSRKRRLERDTVLEGGDKRMIERLLKLR